MNVKRFLNQELVITRRNQLISMGVGITQLSMVAYDLYQYHKLRTTKIGIAHRKWQIAEDELSLYRKKLIKLYGKKYDINSIARYRRLTDEANAAFKVYALMEIDEKLGKLESRGNGKKKVARLTNEKQHIQDNY